MSRVDENGDCWSLLISIYLGASLNVFTNWVGALAAGQEFGIRDFAEAAFFGGLGAISLKASIITGIIEGLYTASKTYDDTKSVGESLIAGSLTGLLSICSAGNIVDTLGEVDVITKTVTDIVFDTASSSIEYSFSDLTNPNPNDNLKLNLKYLGNPTKYNGNKRSNGLYNHLKNRGRYLYI